MAVQEMPSAEFAKRPTSDEINFKSPVRGRENIASYYIRSTDKYVHVVWNQLNRHKNSYINSGDKVDDENGGIFLSYSNNNGQTFSPPYKVISTNGEVKDLQLIARNNDMVITLVENVDGDDWVRAATGYIYKDMTCKFKPCEKVKVDGQLLNAYTFFTEDASADHIYYMKDHKDDGSQQQDGPFKIHRREVRHCTRLDLSKFEKS